MDHIIIDKRVRRAAFRFYTDEEIRKISVKRITAPYAFDNLKQAVPNGLYDPAMGPTDRFSTCITCQLPYKDCPGHMGHVELSVPVYNPLLFSDMYKLLRKKCFICHHLRSHRLLVRKTITKLRLLQAGLTVEAAELEDVLQMSSSASTAKPKKAKAVRKTPAKRPGAKVNKQVEVKLEDAEISDDSDEEDQAAEAAGGIETSRVLDGGDDDDDAAGRAPQDRDARWLAVLASYTAKADAVLNDPSYGSRARKTIHDHDARAEVIDSFMSSLTARRCPNCRGFSPSIKREGYAKLFQMPLPEKLEMAMSAINLRLISVLEEGKGRGSHAANKQQQTPGKASSAQHDSDDEEAVTGLALQGRKHVLAEEQRMADKVKAAADRKKAAADSKRAAGDKAGSEDSDGSASGSDGSVDDDAGSSDNDGASSDDGLKWINRKAGAQSKKADSKHSANGAVAPMEVDADSSSDDGQDAKHAGKAAGAVTPKQPSASDFRAHKRKKSSAEEQAAAGGSLEEINKRKPQLLFPNEIERHLHLLWQEEGELLSLIWGGMFPASTGFGSVDYKIFFLRTVVVPPPRFRPPNNVGGLAVEHPQNYYLKKLIEANRVITAAKQGKTAPSTLSATAKPASAASTVGKASKAAGAGTPASKTVQRVEEHIGASNGDAFEPQSIDMASIASAWLELQDNVTGLIDSSKNSNSGKGGVNVPNGIRQILERKQGLFRMNMMGKRVNFACRSVISPDPYIHTGEIGIPVRFARTLTYPEPVTAWNVHVLRQAVINGPSVHPGANYIEDERGNRIDLSTRTPEQRVALSKTLLTTGDFGYSAQSAKGLAQRGALAQVHGPKTVLRHLRTGDAVLVNRQPTLHKPSMMAHKVRVLPGQQTIRMHYANCNTYNADFDGDEMNVHFPQNFLARAEAYTVANTDNQYLKPTDGTPLRGLIQDHVLSGVLLTQKDRFFTREEFQQLLFATVPDVDPRVPLGTDWPAILKPEPLWTGKQVVSAILNLVTLNMPPLNMVGKTRIPAKSWGPNPEEAEVVVRTNDLCCGVLDKSQFGATSYGLVHAVYELYGPDIAGNLLTVLGRLFTVFLQSYGFTCGIDDLLLREPAEVKRVELVKQSTLEGVKAAARFGGLNIDDLPVTAQALEADPSSITQALRKRLRDKHAGASLDGAMKSALNPMTSKIIDSCLPVGQLKPFPANCMSLMTLSGAKGSQVNFSQIACLLGQQELEGRRVPVMPNGKTLPSFRPFDPSPKAGGYVTQRFLTGIKPQEYYFHCMAGREGLVDTAVKTANSGYLQRCLIKHLESVFVNYDCTVRDVDGSIVQFYYGEDSIDVGKAGYLTQFEFLASNHAAVSARLKPAAALPFLDLMSVDNHVAAMEAAEAEGTAPAAKDRDPVMSMFLPGVFLGSVSDKYQSSLQQFMQANPNNVLNGSGDQKLSPHIFEILMRLKYLYSLVHPGEAVGILAAQSIGEPSTQMTLNTFHLAGHGGANVTLGIPRLREIIMTASGAIRTPIMEIHLRRACPPDTAATLANLLNRERLQDFIQSVNVRETAQAAGGVGERRRLYIVQLNLLPMASDTVKRSQLTFQHFVDSVELSLVPKLSAAVAKELRKEAEQTSKSERKRLMTSALALGDAMGAKGKGKSPSAKAKALKKAPKKLLPVPVSAEAFADVEAEDDDEQESGGARKKARVQSRSTKDEGDDDGDDDADLKWSKSGEADEENDPISGSASADSDADGSGARSTAAHRAKLEAEKRRQDAAEIDGAPDKTEEEDLRQRSVHSLAYVHDVRYDQDKSTVEITLKVPLECKKLLMLSIVQGLCRTVLLKSTPGIGKCFVVEKNKTDGSGKENVIQTDGVNFREIWRYATWVDVNRIHSNDIKAILDTYGVEAARACIVREIGAVFKVYGISVDYRHLGLIADYMTYKGSYRPLNRLGIDSNTSPFQKISFETSVKFLMDACGSGDIDDVNSPSSRLVMGSPVRSGTGCFDLLQPLGMS